MKKFLQTLRSDKFKNARKILVPVVGGLLLIAGVAMIVLPGPAILLIPAGLSVLAIEYKWAQKALEKAKKFLPKRRPRKEAHS